MGKKDPRIDAYIAKSADFAKPILKHIRSVVHEACPQVEETMKWSFPHFDYQGMLCSMAAFKQHAVFGFWKGTLIVANKGKSLEAMGSFGRITKVSDLPTKKILTGYVKQAMALNEQGVKAPVKHDKGPKKSLRVPPYLHAALQKNKLALTAFENYSPSHKREYIEWITEAKSEETRNRRLQTAITWMTERKPLNWKYMKK